MNNKKRTHSTFMEWIVNKNAGIALSIMEIFTDDRLASGPPGCSNNHRIPVRNSVLPMGIDGLVNEGRVKTNNEQLYSSVR